MVWTRRIYFNSAKSYASFFDNCYERCLHSYSWIYGVYCNRNDQRGCKPYSYSYGELRNHLPGWFCNAECERSHKLYLESGYGA